MKISTVAIIVASIAVFMSMVPLVASGQTIPEMLDGQWFSVKASVSGYGDYGHDRATTKGGGNASGFYIYTTYDAGLDQFSMTACSPIPGSLAYSAWTVPSIPVDYVYGDMEVKQVWDFSTVYHNTDRWLRFAATSGDLLDVIPMLLMTVKVDGSTLKSASFKSLGCIGYWFAGPSPYSVGSCKLSGKTVDFDKVPIGARLACIP
jgi:hypothetical protein